MWPFKKRAVVSTAVVTKSDDESSSWGVGGPSFLAMPIVEGHPDVVTSHLPAVRLEIAPAR